jgi:hypothetical protein
VEIIRVPKQSPAPQVAWPFGPITVRTSARSDPQKPWRPSERPVMSPRHGPSSEQNPANPKISPEFARRLGRLAPDAMVHAVVLLDIGRAPAEATGRPSKAERKAIAEAVQTAAAPALVEVDRLLERAGGRRLASGPDLFGSIPVEAPAFALLALASSEHVRAILEDQPISLLREPGH